MGTSKPSWTRNNPTKEEVKAIGTRLSLNFDKPLHNTIPLRLVPKCEKPKDLSVNWCRLLLIEDPWSNYGRRLCFFINKHTLEIRLRRKGSWRSLTKKVTDQIDQIKSQMSWKIGDQQAWNWWIHPSQWDDAEVEPDWSRFQILISCAWTEILNEETWALKSHGDCYVDYKWGYDLWNIDATIISLF